MHSVPWYGIKGVAMNEVTGLLRLEDGQNRRETRLLAEHKLAVVEGRIIAGSRRAARPR
jgi:hypothetical protein